MASAIARWEKFRFNPPPSRQQLEALAKVVGVDADRLEQMLPPAGVGMNLEPIRLCAACYVDSPCHRIEWQFKVTQGCQHHHLTHIPHPKMLQREITEMKIKGSIKTNR